MTAGAVGIEARFRALVSEGAAAAADGLYRESVERLARTRVTVHLARTHLVYGEWLRREQRRSETRQHLRAAHDMFDRFRAQLFISPGTAEYHLHEVFTKLDISSRRQLRAARELLERPIPSGP